MIDKDTFRSVFADFDAEIINQIIEIYINEHPEKFKALEDAFVQKDFENLGYIAHSLKGILSQFYAPEAKQQAMELEYLARELNDYYLSNNPCADIEDAHKDQIKKMIETLKLSSLKVIEDLKNIQKEYK